MSRTSSGVTCRRSARGWTVMPCAPARRQTSTASSTLGTRPPRALRSVATLLTFTDRRINRVSSLTASTISCAQPRICLRVSPRASRAGAARCRNSARAGGLRPAMRASTLAMRRRRPALDRQVRLLPHADVQRAPAGRSSDLTPDPRVTVPSAQRSAARSAPSHRPSPVKRYSEKITWPDCSPPSESPRAASPPSRTCRRRRIARARC